MTDESKAKEPKVKNILRFKKIRYTLLAILAVIIFLSVFSVARFVSSDAQAQAIVQEFGYFGVLIISFIAGLNAIVPVPAATFVPIFTSAGLLTPLIIATMVVGTMLADLLAWYVGVFSRRAAVANYPRLQEFALKLKGKKQWYIVTFLFLYATIAPLPNEIILVPLALAGVKLRVLFIPLLIGTIIYNTGMALGVQSIFQLISL